jgi:hypothetical protein
LEALSFMGYEHASLHDKQGVPLTPVVKWLLSVCMCTACRKRVGDVLNEVSVKARIFLKRYFEEFTDPTAPATAADLQTELAAALGETALSTLLAERAAVLMSLLDEVRSETGAAHLNVRAATSPLFVGGKTSLTEAQLAGRADSITLSFMGVSSAQMRADLDRLFTAEARTSPVYGGISFHYPDCLREDDLRALFDVLQTAQVDGVIVYCYGMAARYHFQWLSRQLLRLAPAA